MRKIEVYVPAYVMCENYDELGFVTENGKIYVVLSNLFKFYREEQYPHRLDILNNLDGEDVKIGFVLQDFHRECREDYLVSINIVEKIMGGLMNMAKDNALNMSQEGVSFMVRFTKCYCYWIMNVALPAYMAMVEEMGLKYINESKYPCCTFTDDYDDELNQVQNTVEESAHE